MASLTSKVAHFSVLRTSPQEQFARPHNLPAPLTSFIGREHHLSEVTRLLATTRLFTLTGAGGVGKTRFSLELAARVLDDFEDGVWLVELAPVSDPQLAPQEILSSLGLRGDAPAAPITLLTEYLRHKNLLLILDNCEHLVAICAELANTLLRACPRLKILATSRQSLGLSGEILWRVPSLSLPSLQPHLSPANLTQYEASRLFIERARAVNPDLSLTPAVASAIAQICHRLDGIPLAIELAAARVKVLTPAQIAARLDDSFRLLTGGSRMTLLRHQTLFATIKWSYDLLSPPEQALFRRLAVFPCGFTLEDAEMICADPAGQAVSLPSHHILDLLSNLIDKSLLLVVQEWEASYRMLDTIRQFAWEQLQAHGEAEPIRQRHLDYFLNLVQKLNPRLMSAEQLSWLNLLEVEQDNWRAALAWSLESGAMETGLRLAVALWPFWELRGYYTEGRQWLAELLRHTEALGQSLLLAQAFLGEGALAWHQGAFALAQDRLEASLAYWQEAGQLSGVASTLSQLGRLLAVQGQWAAARSCLEQSAALAQQVGDRWGLITTTLWLGWAVLHQADYPTARAHFEASAALGRTLGHTLGLAEALICLGELERAEGRYRQAQELYTESFYLSQEVGNQTESAIALLNLGKVARLEGDYPGAAALLIGGINLLLQKQGHLTQIHTGLAALAGVAQAVGQAALAGRLFGAAEAASAVWGGVLSQTDRRLYDQDMAALQAALSPASLSSAWAEGRTLAPEQALTLAKTNLTGLLDQPTLLSAETEAQPPPQPKPYGLTPRELEILRLVAQGLTDAQVAGQLVLSPRTVSKHLQAIYGKLQVSTRSAATRLALEQKLV